MRPPTPQILDFGGGFWILDFGFGDVGFWILDFGDLRFWILGMLDFGCWILDFGEFGFWILGPESQIQNPKSPIQIFLAKFSGFWILDFGSLCSNSLCEAPTPHILDFGGDFEFWILEVGDTGFRFWGFWILDFGLRGFWILDFGDFGDFGFWGFWGFWILDFWNIM